MLLMKVGRGYDDDDGNDDNDNDDGNDDVDDDDGNDDDDDEPIQQ